MLCAGLIIYQFHDDENFVTDGVSRRRVLNSIFLYARILKFLALMTAHGFGAFDIITLDVLSAVMIV